jgi:hypothetical protein
MMEHCLYLTRWCQLLNMVGCHHQVFTVISCTGIWYTLFSLQVLELLYISFLKMGVLTVYGFSFLA